jgi:hypothetical protein
VVVQAGIVKMMSRDSQVPLVTLGCNRVLLLPPIIHNRAGVVIKALIIIKEIIVVPVLEEVGCTTTTPITATAPTNMGTSMVPPKLVCWAMIAMPWDSWGTIMMVGTIMIPLVMVRIDTKEAGPTTVQTTALPLIMVDIVAINTKEVRPTTVGTTPKATMAIKEEQEGWRQCRVLHPFNLADPTISPIEMILSRDHTLPRFPRGVPLGAMHPIQRTILDLDGISSLVGVEGRPVRLAMERAAEALVDMARGAWVEAPMVLEVEGLGVEEDRVILLIPCHRPSIRVEAVMMGTRVRDIKDLVAIKEMLEERMAEGIVTFPALCPRRVLNLRMADAASLEVEEAVFLLVHTLLAFSPVMVGVVVMDMMQIMILELVPELSRAFSKPPTIHTRRRSRGSTHPFLEVLLTQFQVVPGWTSRVPVAC